MLAAAGMLVQELVTHDKIFAMLSVSGQEFDGEAYTKTLPGIRDYAAYWDPLGFCSKPGITEGKIKFYREVELKHGRVGMLAALGMVVGESYHPLFGGDIDVPAYLAFQQTPLQTFWPAVVVAIAIPEIFSVLSFNEVPGGENWSIKSEHESGNLGFDPFEMKPTDPEELKKMQTDELTNGRLGMLAAAGMIAQEMMTHEKIFSMLSVGGQEAAFDGEAYTKSLPGVRDNAAYWDPLGFCSKEGITEGKIKFYREVELKHGRVGMLAALGIVVGESYRPLFGGDIDAPAYLAFQQTPLQTFWLSVVLAIAIPEIFSVFTFESPFGGRPWTIRSDHVPGDLNFDPLGLKPSDPKEFMEMQTKELNNGRLAMIAAAGMIAQEFVTGAKLF